MTVVEVRDRCVPVIDLRNTAAQGPFRTSSISLSRISVVAEGFEVSAVGDHVAVVKLLAIRCSSLSSRYTCAILWRRASEVRKLRKLRKAAAKHSRITCR
jgi:hypothetical protein